MKTGDRVEAAMRAMTPSWGGIHCVFLVALMGAPCSQARVQITWAGRLTAGVRTTFTCSSSCFSNCTYSWSIEGHKISGNTLTWTPDGLKDSLEIKCTEFNPHTGVSTSSTYIAEIQNPLSVQINPVNTVPSLNRSLEMVCHDATSEGLSGGPDKVVFWYKDGGKVSLREDMQLLRNNVTLHFDSPLPSDAGFYQCEISAPQTRVVSRGYLLSFDPWTVSIAGPDMVSPGRLSTFTCITSCTLNVDCTVRWPFRGGFPLGNFLSVSGNELRWTPSTSGASQNFTCVAENVAAGRSAEATKMVKVGGTLLSGSESLQLGGLIGVIISLRLLLLFDL